MTPTLAGRMQTRVLLVLLVGVPWTVVVGPLLALVAGAGLLQVYGVTFLALLLVVLLGVLWELLYHGLQQLRWEKDWPTVLGLLTGITEGLLIWVVLLVLGVDVSGLAFVLHFATTWVLIWVAASTVVRVLLPRWRYRGGRVV